MSFCYAGVGSYWRPHELEAAKKYLGEESSIEHSEYFIWRHNTESVNESILNKSIEIERHYLLKNPHGKVINPVSSYKYTNNKDDSFSVWKSEGINIPNFITFETKQDIMNSNLSFPFLIRLNDGVTGEDTYLVNNEKELDQFLPLVENAYNTKKRISTKKIAVEFIDTSIKDGFKTSFRITVAGNNVISGYARISDDWLAITKQFTENKKEHFIEQNKRLEKILEQNNDEIVRSVSVLGLHHVGIDAIMDTNDNLYFLEVQPFYFCGNTNRTSPPFWNPYKPKLLVDWLVNEKEFLSKEIPMYYNMWLNKQNHFDFCYKSLSEAL